MHILCYIQLLYNRTSPWAWLLISVWGLLSYFSLLNCLLFTAAVSSAFQEMESNVLELKNEMASVSAAVLELKTTQDEIVKMSTMIKDLFEIIQEKK